MAKISFKYGTRAKYDALAVKDPSALYFLTDTGEIYRGSVNLARGNHYEGIRAEGETDLQVITRILGAIPPLKDDIFVIKTVIANDKMSYCSYIFDGTNWAAMDGNYDTETVYFNKDLTFTKEVGYITLDPSGSAVVPAKGKNVNELLEYLFMKELDPTITLPTVAITLSKAGAYEVGTSVEGTYTSIFNAGTYQYGPDTGVTYTYEAKDTQNRTMNTLNGTFGVITVSETPYSVTGKATYSNGVAPLSNMGNPKPDLAITAGVATKTSSAITGYRKIFYGALDTSQELNGVNLRSGAGVKVQKTTVNYAASSKANANRIFVAIPQGSGIALNQVLLSSAMDADITSEFTKLESPVAINGANNYTAVNYDVWIYQPAQLDASETYSIKFN